MEPISNTVKEHAESGFCDSFRVSFAEQSEDEIFIEELPVLVGVSEILGTLPVPAVDDEGSFGLVVNF